MKRDPSMNLEPDDSHHDGTSDATPGGYEGARRPGEAGFAMLMLAASLYLLWTAYGISGFDALSGPGTVPMFITAIMAVSALIILLRTLPLPKVEGESLGRDIAPPIVAIFAGLLVAYALLLKPLGFVPTSALFLPIAIKILSKRSWGFAIGIGLGSLVLIWLIFRIVFTVLMPEGIFPEAEFIQVFRNLAKGGA